MKKPKLNTPYLYQNPHGITGKGNYVLDILLYLEEKKTIEHVHIKEHEDTYIVRVRIGPGKSDKEHYEFTQAEVIKTKCQKLKVVVIGSDGIEPIGKNTIALRDFNDDDPTV